MTKSIRNIKKKTRQNKQTRKRNPMVLFEKEIIVKFLHMLNTVKLFHWRTYSYATHEATDSLYTSLNGHVDKFVEILLGKTQQRANITDKCTPLHDCKNKTEFIKEIKGYKNYLVALDDHKGLSTMANTDLFNIRDEILGDLNQLLYLMTFK